MNSTHYTPEYFSSGLFSQDYAAVAAAIAKVYQPATVLDAGCGPGHLSRELAAHGASVVALDGFSTPSFGTAAVAFQRCDLNSAASLDEVARSHPQRFDLAVCLEVAEHLDPEGSDQLIDFLCARAQVVVFSAAVPGQGGAGHVNCQPREDWHDRFARHGYRLAHRLRPQLVRNPDVPAWYRFNLLDYAAAAVESPPAAELVRSLVAAESALASEFYQQCTVRTGLEARLGYAPVRLYLAARRQLKRLLRPGTSDPSA